MATGNDAIDFPELDGKEVRIGIIKARWHEDVCDSLVAGIKTSLAECGVEADNIIEARMGEVRLVFVMALIALATGALAMLTGLADTVLIIIAFSIFGLVGWHATKSDAGAQTRASGLELLELPRQGRIGLLEIKKLW